MYELLKDSLKKRKNFLMIIVVVQLLSVILSTLLPYMNGMFVDMLIKVTNIEKIIKYSIMIAGLGILSLCFSYIYNLKIMKIKNCTFRINGAPFPRQRCKRLAPAVRYPFVVTC